MPPPPLNNPHSNEPRVCGPQREWARLGLIYPRGAVTRAQLALRPPQALVASPLPASHPPSPPLDQMEPISN